MPEEKEKRDAAEPTEIQKPARRRRPNIKHAVNWLVIIFGGMYFGFHVSYVVWHAATNKDWILEQVKAHYAALIGLPFAAYASVCLVLFLESRYDDPIEFKGFGFEFKGASGPIILWAICFIIFASAMKLLWNP